MQIPIIETQNQLLVVPHPHSVKNSGLLKYSKNQANLKGLEIIYQHFFSVHRAVLESLLVQVLVGMDKCLVGTPNRKDLHTLQSM